MVSIATVLGPVKRLAVAGLLVLGVPGPVLAGLDEGVAAARRGNYETAYKELLPSAHAGNVFAQALLGAMYQNGRGVPLDYAEAAKWYRKAAEQGYGIAQDNLGRMYGNGQGVSQDYVIAHMWFDLAATAPWGQRAAISWPSR